MTKKAMTEDININIRALNFIRGHVEQKQL